MAKLKRLNWDSLGKGKRSLTNIIVSSLGHSIFQSVRYKNIKKFIFSNYKYNSFRLEFIFVNLLSKI